MRHATSSLSMGQQLFALKHRFPNSSITHNKGKLTWEARLTPTEGCETYELRLTWSRGRFPEVWARAGALERCEDLGSIPHQFGFDDKSKSVKLCLQRRDWDSGQLIADTYVSWAMEWLVFFELWLATGEWLGGGEHVA